MGRKKIEEVKEPYSTMLRPKTKRELERLAKKLGISPSQLGSNLIEMGLDDALAIEKIGLLKLCLIADKVLNKIKIKVIKGEDVELTDITEDEEE
jgi:hypothetical protein